MGDTGNIKLRLCSGYDVMLGKAEDLKQSFYGWTPCFLNWRKEAWNPARLDVTGTKSATYTPN